ncbi:MAG: primary-amine oxidase [Actinomycetota bacterium]
MSDTTLERTATHPLDRMTAAEAEAAIAIVKSDPRWTDRMRFASVNLAEPDKELVLAFEPGSTVDRAAEVILLDTATPTTIEVTASISEGAVTSWEAVPGVQPSVILDEFFEAEAAIKEHPDFVAAMAKRGITDMDLITVDPWSAGNYGDPLESGERIIRGLVWVHEQPGDNQYAHPVDGLMVLWDTAKGELARLEDRRVLPVPSGDLDHDEWSSQFRSDDRNGQKPLEITQPEGPSFTIEGDHLSWQNWDLRVGWTSREGLVLHQVNYTDGDQVRPVLYRASLAEMTVPYGDPSETQARKNAFDVGEYGLGMLANSLVLGCDCLGEILYLDSHLITAGGEVMELPQAICIHEEDFGISWKHTDFRTEDVEVRRLRRLVVSFIATVGNYEYGIYWYFYLDGRIECEIKLTGILSTGGLDTGETTDYGTKLGEHLYGANHQHVFCTRLDMHVDGGPNSVVEVDTEAAPPEENPWGNAFRARQTVLSSESAAQRRIDPFVSRFWKVISSDTTNRMGTPTGYKLVAGENGLPFATEDSSIRQRAGYMWNHLWVTPYAADERWPAGKYPNQHAGGAGLPEYTAGDRSVEDTDVVVWYVMNHNHIPVLEDWPVMPVASIGFTLKPSGFFDRSPAIDLPPSNHCH